MRSHIRGRDAKGMQLLKSTELADIQLIPQYRSSDSGVCGLHSFFFILCQAHSGLENKKLEIKLIIFFLSVLDLNIRMEDVRRDGRQKKTKSSVFIFLDFL